MNMRMERASIARRLVGSWLVLTSAVLLGGCGGGGDAGADTVMLEETVPWRAASVIDVAGIASDAGDWPRVVALGAPARGVATLDAGRVHYEPPARWFGRDTVALELQDTDQAPPHKVLLAVTVQAALRLQGVVDEPSLAGGRVEAQVGERRYASRSDAAGVYAIDVTSTDPREEVVVSAAGPHGDALRLASRVGTTALLATVASAEGLVDAASVPALRITRETTEQAALSQPVAPPRPRPGGQPHLEP